MDFNNIFSNSDVLGMVIKESIKNDMRKAVDNTDKEIKIAMLKLFREIADELIEETK